MCTVNQQQLIEDNVKLVYFVINKYYPTFRTDEDIIQCGLLGLCRAANDWGEERGMFSTFATKCINNEIVNELRRRKKHYNILSLDYDVVNDCGEETTFGELQIGEEDIEFIDFDGFYNQLTPTEREIYKLRQLGVSPRDIAKKFGCSSELICKHLRKMKFKWRNINGNQGSLSL